MSRILLNSIEQQRIQTDRIRRLVNRRWFVLAVVPYRKCCVVS